MKKTIILFAVLALTATSCVKDKNTVQGRVTYIGYVTGVEYIASGATVSLASGITATTDANGNYSFTDVKDGAYTIQAATTVNLINYAGSGTASVKGKESQSVNIQMH